VLLRLRHSACRSWQSYIAIATAASAASTTSAATATNRQAEVAKTQVHIRPEDLKCERKENAPRTAGLLCSIFTYAVRQCGPPANVCPDNPVRGVEWFSGASALNNAGRLTRMPVNCPGIWGSFIFRILPVSSAECKPD
jgi:hypothetical protein